MARETVSLILACAGKGARAGFDNNKLLERVDGKTVAEITFSAFYETGLIDEYVIAVSKQDYEFFLSVFSSKAKIVIGGDERGASVQNALAKTTGEIVLVHDGARPFVSKKIIENCIDCVKLHRSAIAAVPSVNTVSKAENGVITETVGKSGVYEIQTPQGFYKVDLLTAFGLANRDKKTFPDESSLYLEYVGAPYLSYGEASNIKLTTKSDFENLNGEAYSSLTLPFNVNGAAVRTGEGFDCHKLVEGRKFIIGGIEIPHSKGLLGHSDADVLTHAVTDAILSAAGLRDIGYHFPDNDDRFLNADSTELLRTALGLVTEAGYKVTSVSAVIMAEKPKLSPYIPSIKENLCKIIGIPVSDFGLGATTLEGLGFVGREEGVCVKASAVAIKKTT